MSGIANTANYVLIAAVTCRNVDLTAVDGRSTPSTAIDRVRTRGRSQKSSIEGVLWPSMAYTQ